MAGYPAIFYVCFFAQEINRDFYPVAHLNIGKMRCKIAHAGNTIRPEKRSCKKVMRFSTRRTTV
jgi:hypothetical protein